MRRPILVTRPARAGERLVDALRRRGCEAVWWPAFDIGAPPDEGAVRQALSELSDYDLAVFVSPSAVHATAQRLAERWPPETVIGAVGAGTRAATLAELSGAEQATIIAPDGTDESGSEAFWSVWQASGRSARRVLLLRAATGRDWIIQQFRAGGAEVAVLPVYQRLAHALTSREVTDLQAWMKMGSVPVVIVSSTEAVDALGDQLKPIQGAADWLRSGIALATHPRVAQRLHSAGFERVQQCDFNDEAVGRKLESIAD